MSTALAIAAVTTMLDYRITQALARSGTVSLESVTAKPPDKAREGGESTNQVNIFLYQTLHNAAWRNQDLPSRVRPGETGRPPLALNLFYLITAYGKNNDDIEGQQLLGMAMQTLHDQPDIYPRDIEKAIDSTNLDLSKRTLLTDSDLKNQIERIRLIPQILSVEEVSKMWATFQAPYRISAAYEASVVLIDSTAPVRTPLPVLTRGAGDRGILAQANLLPSRPTLESLTWSSQELNAQSSIALDEALNLKGHHFTQGPDLQDETQSAQPAAVRLSHPRLNSPIDVPIQDWSATEVITQPLNTVITADWRIGFYTVMLRYEESGTERFSNALSVAIAPTIVANSFQITPATTTNDATLTLNCNPAIVPGQSVSLLLGSQAIAYEWDMDNADITSTPTFRLKNIPSGVYFARLRVDGVDSHVVTKDEETKQLQFNADAQVTIPARSN